MVTIIPLTCNSSWKEMWRIMYLIKTDLFWKKFILLANIEKENEIKDLSEELHDKVKT
jgi:hypothetical protein